MSASAWTPATPTAAASRWTTWSTGCCAITGRIDLVHANNSRDAFDSGADRHANFDTGTIDPQLIAHVCAAARSDVIVETPGGVDGTGADMRYLQEHLVDA